MDVLIQFIGDSSLGKTLIHGNSKKNLPWKSSKPSLIRGAEASSMKGLAFTEAMSLKAEPNLASQVSIRCKCNFDSLKNP